MSFHWRDGWYFKRMENGSVELRNKEIILVIPENEWASIVCSVSALGETHNRWQEARFFHGSEDARKWNAHSQKWEWAAQTPGGRDGK